MDLEPPPVNKAWYKILHFDKLTETGVRVYRWQATQKNLPGSWTKLIFIETFVTVYESFFFQKFHDFFKIASPRYGFGSNVFV